MVVCVLCIGQPLVFVEPLAARIAIDKREDKTEENGSENVRQGRSWCNHVTVSLIFFFGVEFYCKVL